MLSSSQNYLKDWFFTELTINKNEEDEYSRSEFYYPEDLETFNVKTESGIGESREAIDDFIKESKPKWEDGYWTEHSSSLIVR